MSNELFKHSLGLAGPRETAAVYAYGHSVEFCDRPALKPFDLGMASSALAANNKWTPSHRVRVVAAIREARQLDTFTADDVWIILGPTFPVTKGLAACLNAMVRALEIRNTGLTRHSTRTGKHGHAQRLTVWQAI